MTTIGEFINKNINIFEKVSSLEYLVFGVFPKDFLDKPINVNVSQKKGGLILSINGKFVIIINNVFKNSGGGKSKKQKGKGKAKKSRKYQRGGNMKNTIAVIFLSIIMYVFIQNLGMKEFRQPEYHWEIQSANISDLYDNVLPTINLHNTTLDIKTLNKSLTRALTSNNTRQITKFPRNLTLHPLSYAEFNISRLPAHTEIINMFKNISFPSDLAVNSQKVYEILGNWRISNTGLVNIQLFDSNTDTKIGIMNFPNRQDVEERILNFVTETIQIQKKIGMIRKLENKGQFRLGFMVLEAGASELFANVPGIPHYDGLSISERSIPFWRDRETGIQKLYSKRDQLRGGIVSLIYPDNTSKLSQPSIVVDDDGNPIPDTKDSSRRSRKTKYIKGKSSPVQVQMHDQSQSVLHEALPRIKSERLLNLQIMPVINDEFPLREDFIREHAKKGGRKKKKSKRKKRTRKKRKK